MTLYCSHFEAMVIKNMKDDLKCNILYVYVKQCSLLCVSTKSDAIYKAIVPLKLNICLSSTV